MPRPRHVPERRCIACGQRAPKGRLTRIVRTPQGTVHADATGKSSGRGAYLCPASECWERGIRKGTLERSLKAAIAPEDLDSLLNYYRERVTEAASLEVQHDN